jgi:FKBP-type peptidyl-prolyl cis-trans isomerase SlyD
MQVAKDTVVAIDYELFDADGELIEKADAPLEYLHGGYHGIFPRLEAALAGKAAGERCEVTLQPEEAFGDYDAELVRIEAREKFPEGLEVGMQFEGEGDESGETRVFTVTDIAEGKVVVDGNHPLAGKALRFACRIAAVRAATAEELAHGHVHGPHGHHH